MQLSNNRDTWECLKIVWTLITGCFTCLDSEPIIWLLYSSCHRHCFPERTPEIMAILGYPRLQPVLSSCQIAKHHALLPLSHHGWWSCLPWNGYWRGQRLNNEHKCIHCTCMFIMFIHLMHTWPRWCKTRRYIRYDIGRYQTFITDLPIEDPPHYQDLPDLIKVKNGSQQSQLITHWPHRWRGTFSTTPSISRNWTLVRTCQNLSNVPTVMGAEGRCLKRNIQKLSGKKTWEKNEKKKHPWEYYIVSNSLQ